MPGSILAITTLFPFSLHTFHVVIGISLSLTLIETASFLLDRNKLPNSTNLARLVLGCAQKAQFFRHNNSCDPTHDSYDHAFDSQYNDETSHSCNGK